MVVTMAMARIAIGRAIVPPLTAATNWPPIIALTADQPVQAITLKIAMIIAPFQPKEKREIVIWRRPSLGPRVERKATGRAPSALKRIMAITLSQNPRPKTGMARAPRATVEMTMLAENQIVKLSKMRTWVRMPGKMRSIPYGSTPCSPGMGMVSEIIEETLLLNSINNPDRY